jgi:hypothetical protein
MHAHDEPDLVAEDHRLGEIGALVRLQVDPLRSRIDGGLKGFAGGSTVGPGGSGGRADDGNLRDREIEGNGFLAGGVEGKALVVVFD